MTGISFRLKEWRRSQKLSQGQLAGKLGLALRTYSRFETEGRQLKSDALAVLADFGCDISWLLTGKKTGGSKPLSCNDTISNADAVQPVSGSDMSLGALIADGLAPRLLQAGISPRVVGECLIAYATAAAPKRSGGA